jgi:hypothetical protein
MLRGVRRPTARTAGVLLAWLAAVAAATVAGMVAVGAIGSGIVPAGNRPLSQAEVSELLSQSSTPAAAPASPTSTGPTTSPGSPATQTQPPDGETRIFDSDGGTVIARCAPGIEVRSATPAQGYWHKDTEPEDGGLRVRFEGGGGNRVELQLSCVSGVPFASVRNN